LIIFKLFHRNYLKVKTLSVWRSIELHNLIKFTIIGFIKSEDFT